MCGIVGFVTRSPHFFTQDDLDRATHTLDHRGPDHQQTFFESTIGLGHTRLSILDLSSFAHQPFVSNSQESTLVFNGEIYNYKELQPLLHQPLRTTSDTEVLVEILEQMGPDALKQLNGMFAFACWQKDSQRLLVGRDRIGKKPLYYFHDDEVFAFASEPKAILALLKGKRTFKPSTKAVGYFLHLGYVPEPYSAFEGIQKFPSGYVGWFTKDTWSLELQSYWKLEEQRPSINLNSQDVKKQCTDLLLDSTAHRLIADVPVGSFLSGGIDSSLVTALATKASSKTVETFSIGFKNWDKNEAEYARKVADHLKTSHNELYIHSDDAKNWLQQLPSIYDEPLADASVIPSLMVSAFAKTKVKVALSGDGGDELFFGYGAYQWSKRFSNPALQAGKGILSYLLQHSGKTRFQRVGDLLDYPGMEVPYSHIFSQESYFFKQSEVKMIQMQDAGNVEIPSFVSGSKFLSPMARHAITDLIYYLKDDLMVKMDRASMSQGLEVRNPLLDYRLVEFAIGLSDSYKIQGKTTKVLLKNILFDMVPASLFDRPKWGFSVPLHSWLQTDLGYLVDDFLSKEKVLQAGLLRWEDVQYFLNAWRNGKTHYYNRIWQMVVLHRWYFHYFENI